MSATPKASKMDVILDIDHTLLLSKITHKGRMKIIQRPYLSQFLEMMFQKFRHVFLWSSADMEWILAVLKHALNPLLLEINRSRKTHYRFSAVFHRDYCDIVNEPLRAIKPLARIIKSHPEFVLDLNSLLTIDDDPATFSMNPDNAIQVERFFGSADDHALLLVMAYVKETLIPYFRKHGTLLGFSKPIIGN